MRRHECDFFWLLVVAVFVAAFWFKYVQAKEARTIKLDDKKIATIYVHAGRSTVLSFPIKPNKIVLGNTGEFAVQYIENDLAISPLSANSSSNLFVYLYGRRFAFDLVPSRTPDEIVIVCDAPDRTLPLRIKNE